MSTNKILRLKEYFYLNLSTTLRRQTVVVSPPNNALHWRIWKNPVRAKHSNNLACQCMTETSWGHSLGAKTLKGGSTLICCTTSREAI